MPGDKNGLLTLLNNNADLCRHCQKPETDSSLPLSKMNASYFLIIHSFLYTCHKNESCTSPSLVPIQIIVPTGIRTHSTFSNIPQTRVSTAVSKTRRLPLFGKSQVFIHGAFRSTRGKTKGNGLDQGLKSSETPELRTQTLALVPSRAAQRRVESMRLVKR